MTPTLAVLVAVLGSSTVSATVAHLLGRRRSRADVADVLTEAAARLVADLRAEVDRLRAELATARGEINRLSYALNRRSRAELRQPPHDPPPRKDHDPV